MIRMSNNIVIEDGPEVVGESGYVYLLHFSSPLSHARHYIGWAKDIDERMEQHQKGRGSCIVAAAIGAGIKLSLVRLWKGDRHFERRLKKRKNAPKLCPICEQETDNG